MARWITVSLRIKGSHSFLYIDNFCIFIHRFVGLYCGCVYDTMSDVIL